jgi:hypothetical protein
MEPKGNDDTVNKEGKEEEGFETIDVLRFNLRIKKGKAYVGEKPQADGESKLKGKFGDRYDEVRGAFDDALKVWEGKQDELMRKTFWMYEHFRPSVQQGAGGWGRKSELDLGRVKEVVETS